MTTQNISFFSLASDRMNWLSARQKVTSENVANANTPNFKARDVVSFADLLDGSRNGGVRLATTHAGHVGGLGRGQSPVAEVTDRNATVSTLDGNSVDLEEQAMRSAETADQYRLAADLYRKGFEMLGLAVRKR